MPFLASMKYTEKMASPSSKTSSQQNYQLRNLLFKNFRKSMPCREIRCMDEFGCISHKNLRLNLCRKINLVRHEQSSLAYPINRDRIIHRVVRVFLSPQK